MHVELTWRLVAFAVVVVGWLLATRWSDQVAHLHLTFFRPWRGDPWPQGVQEDDDVRWRWTRPRSSTADEGGPAPMTPVRSIHVGRPGHHA